ncbi:MAG TPA: L-threonylcarbamoyladenylate synthase, partial [Longimicrobiaceae bacterium]|nr:L-threonylcarbamoyladenylate synthase [Longimicrobiaceae bacterium]
MSVIRVDPNAPEGAVLTRAANILRSGGLVAFPTETVYGLGANALDPAAVARIYEAKGRPGYNPLIVHVADVDAARALSSAWPALADELAAAFWPGPL